MLTGGGPDPAEAGAVDALPGHNVSVKRDVLLEFGDRLPDLLVRGGGLLDELKDAGHAFALGAGRVAHLNPSRLASTAALRFDAGRLYGVTRAEREGWGLGKRLAYTVGGPAIPLVRMRRVREELFPGSRERLLPRVYPALALGLVMDGLGQMTGYALGGGGAQKRLSTFEMDRIEHLNASDQGVFGRETSQPDSLEPA